ncbi:MAG: NAD(P)-dependent alcohol dehydrogenase, partial [Pseudomonadota bacterium]
QLEEVEKPAPHDNEVLIRIHATSVTAGDYRMRGFQVPIEFWLPARLAMGITRPKKSILGMNFSGTVEAVGKNVKRFRKGDKVFGTSGARYGAYAEYLCLPEDGALVAKPATITFDEAAAFPFGALTALFFLRDQGNIQRGQEVLIYGASGAVGTAAVQLARYYGAEVTGVCSTANVDLVKSLGATKVIDYTKEDFTASGESYDIIFDTVGKTSFARCTGSLKKDGRCLLTVFRLKQLIQMLWTSMTGDKKVICAIAPDRAEDLKFLVGLVEAGRMKTVVDRRYPLEQTAEAHRYAEKGHKKGNVVITLEPVGNI